MANLNVAVLGPIGYANDLGKKGTTSDITFYNLKRGEETVTFIEASKYPERLASLFFAISMASKAIVIVDEINAYFGEQVVMLQCAGLKDGILILRNFLTKEKVAPLIKGTVVEQYECMSDDKNALREKLLGDATRLEDAVLQSDQSTGIAVIDHAFNVKGVGLVALGAVKKGTVRKHDELKIIPGDKKAQVRSIQKHDDDFEESHEGDRVGLALKNIELEDLDRGSVLTNDEAVRLSATIEGKSELVKYWPAPLKAGMALHIGHWMQFIPAKVESVTDSADWHKTVLKLSLDKGIAHLPGDRAVIMYLAGAKLRIVGTIELG